MSFLAAHAPERVSTLQAVTLAGTFSPANRAVYFACLKVRSQFLAGLGLSDITQHLAGFRITGDRVATGQYRLRREQHEPILRSLYP